MIGPPNLLAANVLLQRDLAQSIGAFDDARSAAGSLFLAQWPAAHHHLNIYAVFATTIGARALPGLARAGRRASGSHDSQALAVPGRASKVAKLSCTSQIIIYIYVL